jgi:hypothetical protein
MTAFDKEKFSWDGMYLMYGGDQGKYTVRYGEDGRECHPSRVGMIKPMFIARFKYGSKPWRTYRNTFASRFTVEQVVEMYAEGMTPLAVFLTGGGKQRKAA